VTFQPPCTLPPNKWVTRLCYLGVLAIIATILYVEFC
jgi:hypothetical protein